MQLVTSGHLPRLHNVLDVSFVPLPPSLYTYVRRHANKIFVVILFANNEVLFVWFVK